MFKYDGYVIKTKPDYSKALKKGENIEEIWCEVYQESDTEFKRCLNEFNMMPCFEYKENTVAEIENGIKNIIDSDCAYLELQIKQEKFERQSALFNRAVEFIKESIGGDDIENTLKLCLGMTDEEIKETLDGLNESEEIQDSGMNLV